MSVPSPSWSLERFIPSETGAGKAALDEVLHELQRRAWTEHDVFGVHLALEEALVNAIRHGNGLDPVKRVHLVCRVEEDRLWIRVCDEGPGFRPDQVPDPTRDDRLEVPSGRGLMLMRAFMSQVEYNDRGNCVTMEKQRSA